MSDEVTAASEVAARAMTREVAVMVMAREVAVMAREVAVMAVASVLPAVASKLAKERSCRSVRTAQLHCL